MRTPSDISLRLSGMYGMKAYDYIIIGADAVVDSEPRVHGMEALRVFDALVMPRLVSGNLNAPTRMNASRAADWILGMPQLEPFEARFAFQEAVPN